MRYYCGFDFGTSNTVVTLLGETTTGQKVFSDATVLFLPDCGPYAQRRYVGEEAVTEYVNAGMDGRFIQSIKSVLPDPGFTRTQIYEKTYTPEELVAMILTNFKERVEDFIGEEISGAVFGRPVRFSTEEANDALAEERLRAAAGRCGFDRVSFSFEPVAAALRYQDELSPGDRAIVCDLGGGTADFSVIVVDRNGAMSIPASFGVRVGGDDFDSQIMWHRLVSYFGFGTEYESYDKLLPVPVHIYRTICRWDRIPFLKTTEYHDDLKYIRNGAVDKAAIDRLISLIEDDLGFALFRAIRDAKHDLSHNDSAAVRFFEKTIELKERIYEGEFSTYIEDEIHRIEEAVLETLGMAGVAPRDIHTVFLTGGSSAVRQVQKHIATVLPGADIRHDTEMFNSVSLGLAMEAKRIQLATAS